MVKSMGALSEINEGVSEERKIFLDAALDAHLGAELAQNISGIIDTYSDGGHLSFNGDLYDTAESLEAFHVGLGFADLGTSLIRGLRLVSLTRVYSFDTVIGEFRLAGKINKSFPGVAAGYSAEWSVAAIYQFNAEGKLVSERAYFNTGGLLPEAVMPEFTVEQYVSS